MIIDYAHSPKMRSSERRSVTQMFTTAVVSATLSSFLCQSKALRGSPRLHSYC